MGPKGGKAKGPVETKGNTKNAGKQQPQRSRRGQSGKYIPHIYLYVLSRCKFLYFNLAIVVEDPKDDEELDSTYDSADAELEENDDENASSDDEQVSYSNS